MAAVSLAQTPTGDGLSSWKTSSSGGVSQWFEINGTGGRNNPLRRKLDRPVRGDQIFVRFKFRYSAESIDTPESGNGEFFILWLDAVDGGDGAVHNGGIPNVGLHVTENRNAFMARFDSKRQFFADKAFSGDRDYSVLAKLSKSTSGDDQPFDQLSVWVDPQITDSETPDIQTSEKQSTKRIKEVQWIGFATGAKTERGDSIAVSDVVVAESWLEAFGLSIPELETKPAKQDVVETLVTTVDFRRDVFPILKRHCLDCHQGTDPDSGLRLDNYDELLNQVSPRNAAESHLVRLIESENPDERMPPIDEGEPLNAAETRVLRTWIDEGVHWDSELLPTPIPKSDHWAFQPLQQVAVPESTDVWVRTPVDAFVLQQQRAQGLSHADRADWKTLQRRIALDLTGLPPSQFPLLTEATSDEQLDEQIDRLLRSDAYGERWGRHWLDLARWSESNGHQHNRLRPHAWRYRDYVIDSFAAGKPFDRFVREQIAGDLIDEFDPDHLVATGFLSAARYSGNELDKEIQRNDLLVDVVNTTAKAFLGVTMECAQCHTHKFDPFSIRDYYRFQAFFSRGQPGNVVLATETQASKTLTDLRWSVFNTAHQRIVDKRRKAGSPDPILVTPKSVVSGMTGKERAAFNVLDEEIAKWDQSWSWTEAGTTWAIAPHEMRWPLPNNPDALAKRKTFMRLRGDVKSVGPEVRPGWPAVFGASDDESLSRIDLADWIASPENPMTARVWVNRIWQWHFGRGLVDTSGDFGTQGSVPSHPQLLDWLATQLIESGWNTNTIHELILRSNTYRQSAVATNDHSGSDPENQFLWHWKPRRLESEAIRDCVLAVSGQIDLDAGGPSVPASQAASSKRRSVYLTHQRQRLPSSLTLFDSPAMVNACSRRRVSTVALQPLYLLNSDFMQRASESFAQHAEEVAGEGSAELAAFRLALGREATPEEEAKLTEFVSESSLQSLCLVLLNLSEFVYIN